MAQSEPHTCRSGRGCDRSGGADPQGIALASAFLRILNQSSSEITGLGFNPAGNRLCFSSQRRSPGKVWGGITYEVTSPFRA